MTPQEALTAAVNAENDTLVGVLRERCARLHAEVLMRDARIAELETEKATAAKGDQP